MPSRRGGTCSLHYVSNTPEQGLGMSSSAPPVAAKVWQGQSPEFMAQEAVHHATAASQLPDHIIGVRGVTLLQLGSGAEARHEPALLLEPGLCSVQEEIERLVQLVRPGHSWPRSQ